MITKRPSIFDDPVPNFLTRTPSPLPPASPLVVTELPNRSLSPSRQHHDESPKPRLQPHHHPIPSSFYLHREQQQSQPVHSIVSQHPTVHPNTIHHTTAHPTLHPESQSTSYQSYIRHTTTPVPITTITTTPVPIILHSQSPTLHPHRFPRTHHPVQQPQHQQQQQQPQRVHRFQALQKNPTSAELRLMPTPHPEHIILDNPGPFRFTEEDYPALDYPEFTEPPRPGLLPFIPAVPPEGPLGPPPPPPRRPSIPSGPLTKPPQISDFEAALAGPHFSRPRPRPNEPPTPGPSPRPVQASTPPPPENVPDVAFPGLLNNNALGPETPPPRSKKPTFGPTIVPIVHASYYPSVTRPPVPKPDPYPIPVTNPNTYHPQPSTTPYPGYKPRPYPSTYHPAQHSGGQSHVHFTKRPPLPNIHHPYKSIFSTPTPIPKPQHHSPVPSHNNHPFQLSHFSNLVPSPSSVTTAQPAAFQLELDHNNNIDDFKQIRPTVNKSYIHTTPGSAGIESFSKHNAWKHKDKPNTTWFWLRI